MNSDLSGQRLFVLPAALAIWLAASAIAAQWIDPGSFLLAMGLLAFTATLAGTHLFRFSGWAAAFIATVIFGLVQVALKGWMATIVAPMAVFILATVGTTILAELVAREVRQLRRQIQQDLRLIEELRLVDPDTGLLSHQHIQHTLRKEIIRSQRYDKNVCVLLMRVENQDSLDAELGPERFQALKRQVASVLVDSLRATDVAFVHGEGWGAILPETNLKGAQAVFKRFYERVTRKARVGLHLGLAQFPTDGVTEQEIMQAAEAALQVAQTTGQPAVYSAQLQQGARAEGAPQENSGDPM